jgi:hypothetical protein
MKHLLYCVLSCVLGFGFFACRKGEGDPAVSLRTRTARLCGDWTVNAMLEESHYTTADSGTIFTNSNSSRLITTSIRYNRIELRSSYFNSSGTSESVWTGAYKSKYVFKKDGSFTVVEFISDYYDYNATAQNKNVWHYSYEHSGTWAFVDGKGKDYKNKERIVLSYLHTRYSRTITDPKGSRNNFFQDYVYGAGQKTETWDIGTLRNKELMIHRSELETTWSSSTFSNQPLTSKSGSINDAVISYTFTQ